MREMNTLIDALAQLSKQKFIALLDNILGDKNLVLESCLMKPLERFIGASEIKKHGVTKMFKFSASQPAITSNTTLVYLVQCDLIVSKKICDQINSLRATDLKDLTFHVIYVPRVLAVMENLFEEEGLYDIVEFHVLPWELIQLDICVLSFEIPQIFKQLFVENDQSLLPSIAKSLWSLQHVFGKIPFSLFHGRYSKLISNQINLYMNEMGAPDKVESDIGAMIVVDRDADYSSVLLTPGTYTSLVADIIEIKSSFVTLEQPNAESQKLAKVVLLSSNDEVYKQIKNKHFSEVFVYLSNRVKDCNAKMKRHKQMSIQEMKEYVQNNLRAEADMMESLTPHIAISEKVTKEIGQEFEKLQTCQNDILVCSSRPDVINYLEDLMAQRKNVYRILRLISLLTLTQADLSNDESNNLKKQFFHAFGYEHLNTFFNLEKMGLFPAYSNDTSKLASKMAQVVSLTKKSTFQTVAQKMSLFPSSEYSLKDSQDMSSVFGGCYIPVVAQLVNLILKKEILLDEIIKMMPGNTVPGKCDTEWHGSLKDGMVDVSPRCILVYVVGGVTYAEIAALQLLEAQRGCKIIVAGSSIITGNSLVQAAM